MSDDPAVQVQQPAMNIRLGDVAAGLGALIPVLLTFFGNERRYEMLGLAALILIFYTMYRMNARSIQALQISNAELKIEARKCHDELKLMAALHIAEMKEERDRHVLEVRAIQNKYSTQAGMLQATILNMHADLTLFAGGRATGQLDYDAVAETYRYTRAPRPIPPDATGERRTETPK